ncbi:tail fiber [Anabaena phage Elbi]|nr:tail fiber [Anabaena phage Elbi]
MTNILGRIGFLTTGKLGIKLRGIVIDESTTPNTTYLPDIESFFNITANVLTSVSYPETETQNVSATLSIYAVDVSNNPILPALYEFDAIIPNVASVEFDVLAPTGVVNNQLDTSALRIARLIANDPALAQKVAGAPYPRGAYDSGATYLYGEMVSYFGKNYISKSLSPITGILPTNVDNWYELVITLPPEVSVIATGSDTAYAPGWNGSLLVPTQNAVYDKIVTVDAAIVAANTNIANLGTSKADLSYVNTELASDQLALNNLSTDKADLIYVNSQLAGKANLSSPNFSGNPTAPTPATDDADTSIATTAYVKNNLANYPLTSTVNSQLAGKANLNSPALTGVPTTPTPGLNSNNASVVNTAFVQALLNAAQDDQGRFYVRVGYGIAIKYGSTVITTSGEVASITLGGNPAFTTIITVIATNGDATVTQANVLIQSFSNFNFVVRTPSFNGNIRVNWIAIGYIV